MAFTSRLQRAPAPLSGRPSLTGRHDQNGDNAMLIAACMRKAYSCWIRTYILCSGLKKALCRAAWKQLEDMPAEQAQQRYIELVTSLSPTWQEHAREKASTGGLGGPVFSSLVNSKEEADTGPVSAQAQAETVIMLASGGTQRMREYLTGFGCLCMLLPVSNIPAWT